MTLFPICRFFDYFKLFSDDIIRQKYGYNCQIKIIDDQFHIVYPDGSIIELSEEILDQINAIGKDNEYAAHTR